MLKPVTREDTVGEVDVRQLFRVSRRGTIAGCYVTRAACCGALRRASTGARSSPRVIDS